MTQKEYNKMVDCYEERIKIISNAYEEQIRELEDRLDIEKSKIYNYEQVLKDYHRVSEELNSANRAIDMHEAKEQSLFETIRRYEKLLDRVSIQVVDGNRF